MSKELRKKWIDALRSGDYEQGKGYLRQHDYFCCLGVLCDLVDKNGWDLDHQSGIYSFDVMRYRFPPGRLSQIKINKIDADFEFKSLPNDLKEKILEYFTESDPLSICTAPMSLAELNDHGVPFSLIADIIEAEPEGLFYE